MFCPICNKEVEEGTLVCPVCHGRVSEHVQQNRISCLKAKAVDFFAAAFKTPVFLALFISLAAVGAAGALVTVFAIKGGLVSVLVNAVFYLIPGIYALNSAYGAWKLYKSTNGVSPDHVKSLAKHPKVYGGYNLFYTVIYAVSSLLIFLVLIILTILTSSAGNEIYSIINEFVTTSGELGAEDAAFLMSIINWFVSSGALIITILFLVFVSLSIFCSVHLVITYKKTKAYYEMLSDFSLGAGFDKDLHFPKNRLIIFGALGVFSGISGITTSLGSLFSLFAGVYLIITALWFVKISEQQRAIAEEIEEADEILADIRVRTNAEIGRMAAEAAASADEDN